MIKDQTKLNVIAIDPGTFESAVIIFKDGEFTHLYEKNEIVRQLLLGYNLRGENASTLAMEMIASYGMAVGKSVFETCVWIGRFIEAYNGPFDMVYRKDVKMFLCHSMRAKDGNIRQAIIDLYGGKDIAIGNKKCPKCKGKGWFKKRDNVCKYCKGAKWLLPPGPLVGIAEDEWAALGVALTWFNKN